jgi:ribA/ribD-fused uncharacterized protein
LAARRTILAQILQTYSPREQKALGRTVPDLDDSVWGPASVHIVTCISIARAEVDLELREIYLQAGKRRFVEGGPKDKVWGIGLVWDDPRADDETQWKGGNRLGLCHDEASNFIRDNPRYWEEADEVPE